MVGMGFRRIALAQGLLGQLDRNTTLDRSKTARLPEPDWRGVDREPIWPAPARDTPGKDTTAENRVHPSH